jgi:hypothetical protein
MDKHFFLDHPLHLLRTSSFFPIFSGSFPEFMRDLTELEYYGYLNRRSQGINWCLDDGMWPLLFAPKALTFCHSKQGIKDPLVRSARLHSQHPTHIATRPVEYEGLPLGDYKQHIAAQFGNCSVLVSLSYGQSSY